MDTELMEKKVEEKWEALSLDEKIVCLEGYGFDLSEKFTKEQDEEEKAEDIS